MSIQWQNNRVFVNRIRDRLQLGPIVELFMTARSGEIPFTPSDFVGWCGTALKSDSTLVCALYYDHEPTGFFLAFAPWTLYNMVHLQFLFIRPAFRSHSLALIREGFSVLRSWQKALGARGVSFVTDRPRGWQRILREPVHLQKAFVEV